jgi:membrane protease YdiL (CAAX protease family)
MKTANAVLLACLAPLLHYVLLLTLSNVWYRMAVAGLLLSVLAILTSAVDWRALYRPSLRHVATGIAAAVLMYAGGWVVVRTLHSPAAAAQIAVVYGWRQAVPGGLAVPLLLFIVLAEEVVWRAAVTQPLAARFGAGRGVAFAALAFALAHVPTGIPVLVAAAFVAGAFWSALVVYTRSGIPALVSHVVWDLAVLFWAPYLR